ncbi:MAG: GNAT family N-acetyltransferase [Verrucomicrobia bacterium]|nr:GNAT family N-acetyltransferase [Verrucomicrobiota bacterium]
MGDKILARRTAPHAYSLRLARNAEDVRAAQTLRFLVFNVELNEGLEQSFATCRDADQFDEVCDHLIVEDEQTQQVVGTYRLQTGANAAARLGYYSAQEFDLAPFAPARAQVIELGRACVHSGHRNLTVLGLLWKGIHHYARARGGRWLIGCSSLPTQDTAAGASAYFELQRRHLAEPAFRTTPLPPFACPLAARAEKAPKLPRLLAAYLSLGAKICGPPAVDRGFKTIDFLTLLDLDSLPAATVRRYLN